MFCYPFATYFRNSIIFLKNYNNKNQKIPPTQSKWEIIHAMPEAHYCGKSVGNSSAQIAETFVNNGFLPL